MRSSKDEQDYKYEPVERFGKSMTSNIPWNLSKLRSVELINGRFAMLGISLAVIGELATGKGALAQLGMILSWYMSLGT